MKQPCVQYEKIFSPESTCLIIIFFDLFRNWSVCFGSYKTDSNDPKNLFLFRETNQKSTETDWVSVRTEFFLVSCYVAFFRFDPKQI
jgi:hypothetical protein